MKPNYEQIARAAGFVQVEDGTVTPANPNEEGFWEDWQSCCEANGLTHQYVAGINSDYCQNCGGTTSSHS